MSDHELVERLSREATERFARWDPTLWRSFVEGPATRLAQRLEAKAEDPALCAPLLESFLTLGAQAVGLGYLSPAEQLNVETLFNRLWQQVIPERLAEVPAPRRASILAQCWNLAENLETGPHWLSRVFVRACDQLKDLQDLESFVQNVSRSVLSEPAQRLGSSASVEWVFLGYDDRRFLPGFMHFVAPTVLCVHDRHRMTAEGHPLTLGVWAASPALVVGPMRCEDLQGVPPCPSRSFAKDYQVNDPRWTESLFELRNDWRAAAALTTSQMLVIAQPRSPTG